MNKDRVELFRARFKVAVDECGMTDTELMAIFYGTMLLYGFESTQAEMTKIMKLGRMIAEETLYQQTGVRH